MTNVNINEIDFTDACGGITLADRSVLRPDGKGGLTLEPHNPNQGATYRPLPDATSEKK